MLQANINGYSIFKIYGLKNNEFADVPSAISDDCEELILLNEIKHLSSSRITNKRQGRRQQ
jgi:hypothetical protein